MTLYCSPGSISVAAALALHEAGLPFQQARVNFAAAEQTGADYHRINPKGRVPALVTEDGILTETGAILDYVAARAPEAGLVPPDAFAAAKMRETMYYLASTMHVNHAHRMRGHRWASLQSSFDDMASKVTETMTACCAHIEDHALRGPYVLGDGFSLADPYLFVVTTWLSGDGVELARFPKLSAFVERMHRRPSVRAMYETGLLQRKTA
ncbi:glutathione S-transferase family protein [Sedimentitalea sp. JM2-8]|uniref:Glutathione S-transferase family protein n=1 Tax=Sedimentitalea xiamensis TaxID=3050037 RepID=A0ABT7FGJ8_9RHOB|nr:glutathione S-transferase family protein [Sedimentitalea xiamensis]MDK3074252.1 glutathione S-transferase family protein [Sedimentitalea xiamensis]